MIEKGSNLTRNIVERLGSEIVSGVYSPRNPFPNEATIVKRYQVSRTIVREAIKMLTSKGLLLSRPRLGTTIRDEKYWHFLDPDVLRWLLQRGLSIPLLIEFTDMRIAIEPQAARLAIRNAGAEERQRLVTAMDAMKAAGEGHGDPLETDIDLHVAILEASCNRFLIQHRDLIRTALTFSIRVTNRERGFTTRDMHTHSRIVESILAGDEDSAVAATLELLNQTMDVFKSMNINES